MGGNHELFHPQRKQWLKIPNRRQDPIGATLTVFGMVSAGASILSMIVATLVIFLWGYIGCLSLFVRLFGAVTTFGGGFLGGALSVVLGLIYQLSSRNPDKTWLPVMWGSVGFALAIIDAFLWFGISFSAPRCT